MADAIDSLSISNMADPAPMGMGMGTSQLLINFKPESQIKQGQSVFVSYDMAMAMANGLQDLSGNTVESFTQVINNSSSIYNDLEAPTLIGTPALNPDGQTFTLSFNEPLDTQTIDTQSIANNFNLFVDGNDFGATFDNTATTLSADGTSLTLKLDGRTIEGTQQILIAYDPQGGAPLYDTSNNNLEAFTFSVMNASAVDFTPPELTGVTNVDPSGQSINIPFSEMVVIDDPIAAKAAFTISIDGTALRNDQFSINAYGGASLQIDLNDRVYNDQTLTVAYNSADLNDNAGELKDNNGNFVASFNQLIDTSPIADSAPDLQAPVLTASSTSSDGQTISLNFSEELSGNLDNNTFQISLNGRDLGMGAVDSVSQTVNADGSSTVDITLFSNQAVGQGESLVVSYDPAIAASQLADSFGNSVDAFQQAVNNSSTAAPQDLVAPNVTSGNTDPQGQFISIDFDEQLQTLDAAQLDSLKYSLRIVVDGRELMADAIDSLSIDNMADPAPMGMGMGTSQLIINFKPESQIKQGQSVFVSYDMAMAMANGLQDLSGNTVDSFTQVINNSSTIYNDLEAPTLTGEPELNPDGQTFTLSFNEPLDTQTIDTQSIANSFKVFVDGNDFGATFDNNATTLSADGTSLTLKLDGRTIEGTQQILIAYDPQGGAPLYDTSNNNLEAFTFSVMNASAVDFTPPELTGEPCRSQWTVDQYFLL